jgi:hypothetical protein
VRDGQHIRPWWRMLLDAQRSAGFPDLAGSEGTLQLTLSDALLNAVIAARLPATWPVLELTLHALDRNEIAVRVRPRSAWLPPVQARVTIDDQPITPSTPLLHARLTSSVGRLAGLALGSARLPAWIRVSGDDVTVDLQALAAQQGVADLLALVQMLTINTTPGRVIVTTTLAVEHR